MSSLYDTDVRNRREHTPWANVNAFRFMREMALNVDDTKPRYEQAAVLSVHSRPDVASRFWWTMEWTGTDGERHSVSAQDLDLCLWRAAESETRIMERLEHERKSAANIALQQAGTEKANDPTLHSTRS